VSERLVGFAFPFRVADADVPAGTPRTAGVARSSDAEKIRDDVAHLLGTRIGERLMDRTYGGGIHGLLQEPSTTTMQVIARHDLQQALRLFLPELRIVSPIEVSGEESELRIAFDYTAEPRDTVHRLEVTIP
jgi:phage baseplate assembly protein W